MAAEHESFLRYAGFRHLKLALLGLALAVGVYALDDTPGGPNGGTPLGYALGGIAAALILWLMWFGVRKRRYTIRGAKLAGWLSAHVYLGVTLLLLVPLHAGFQFGWNVHTAAYALMTLVILSGTIGVLFYASVPRLVTENRPGEKLDHLVRQIGELDAQCKSLAAKLPDAMARITLRAVEETRIGGGVLRQISGVEPRCATAAALGTLRAELPGLEGPTRETALSLVETLARKNNLLVRVRRDIRYRALLKVWLLFHVPLSFALLAAVGVHVFSVFYYW